jgi:dolichol kinase
MQCSGNFSGGESNRVSKLGDDRSLKWAVLKQHRSLPHALRRLYHLLMGLACFSMYAWVINRQTACWAIVAIGGPFFMLDVLRLQSPWLRKLALRYFGPLMRRNELLGLTGNSFFILGLFFVVFFFTKPIALLSILFLAVGDPVAAFVGTRYGKTKIMAGKSLEGALANLLASGLVSAVFGVMYLQMSTHAWLLALVGGVASAIAELIPFPGDDNFSVPVIAGIQLSLIDHFWPFF